MGAEREQVLQRATEPKKGLSQADADFVVDWSGSAWLMVDEKVDGKTVSGKIRKFFIYLMNDLALGGAGLAPRRSVRDAKKTEVLVSVTDRY